MSQDLTIDDLKQVNKLLSERVAELEIQLSLRPAVPVEGEKWFCPRCNDFVRAHNAGRVIMCGRCMRGRAINLGIVDIKKELRRMFETEERLEDLKSQKCTIELDLDAARRTIDRLRREVASGVQASAVESPVESGDTITGIELLLRKQVADLQTENEALRVSLEDALHSKAVSGKARLNRSIST
jgi:hypothetical protein